MKWDTSEEIPVVFVIWMFHWDSAISQKGTIQLTISILPEHPPTARHIPISTYAHHHRDRRVSSNNPSGSRTIPGNLPLEFFQTRELLLQAKELHELQRKTLTDKMSREIKEVNLHDGL